MKRFLHASTAFCLIFGGSLFAQTRFDVPFPFQANGKTMPAGRYEVRSASIGGSVFQFSSRQNGSSALVSLPSALDSAGPGGARMVFHCASGSCAVAELWLNHGRGGKRTMPAAANGPVMIGAAE